MKYPVSASAITGTVGSRLQTIWAAYRDDNEKTSRTYISQPYINEVIQSCNGQIGLTHSRRSCSSTAEIQTI